MRSEELQHFFTRVEREFVGAVGPLMAAVAQADEDHFIRVVERRGAPEFHVIVPESTRACVVGAFGSSEIVCG